MLSPKKIKWRKIHRGRLRGQAKRGTELSFGDFGLMSVSAGRMTDRQIEASRIAISRSVKRSGKVWIRVFPDKPITQKPIGVRMGSGKGNLEFWVALIKPGRILFEIEGVTREQAQKAFRLASYKLPFKTKFVSRM
ncbi:MAG: 50S ribosomal protein L16 [Bdellovibrionales bacterium]|nr:50S ribosomal protein L16 [Bdellovibrionales bacterium]